MDDKEFEKLRQQMVTTQIERRGVCNQRVLTAMRRIPRHYFVSPREWEQAYEDHPLPIGEGQTISQPYIVALMTDTLDLHGDENVLEVGTGSGYQAAILSMLAKTVHTVERIPSLAERARLMFARLGIENVHVHVGDGTLGWVDTAPYQGILITAAAPYVPRPLLDQLDIGGKLVIPVGARYHQDLQLWRRVAADQYHHETILPVAFVPLLGEHGWNEKKWQELDF